MNVSVLYFDKETPAETTHNIVQNMKDVLEDTVVFAIPKDYDMLLDCSVDQLLSIRAVLDTAISVLIQQQHPEAFKQQTQAVEQEDAKKESNIIEFSKYLS